MNLFSASCVALVSSFRVRKLLTRALARIVGVDIQQIFRTQREAAGALADAIGRAHEMLVFTGRGSELTRSTFDKLWNDPGDRLRRVRILLPDPQCSGVGTWLDDREQEIAGHDRAYGGGLIVEQIKANILYLDRKVSGNPNFEVRLYDFPHLARIVVTDHVAFLTMYSADRHGSASPCIMVSSAGPIYDFCRRIFDKAWDAATVQ